MDRYVTRTKDFKPSDIPSFVSNEKQILLEVVSSLLKSKYKNFQQGLDCYLLKKLIQENISSYDAGNLTVAEVKRQNYIINKREEEMKKEVWAHKSEFQT